MRSLAFTLEWPAEVMLQLEYRAYTGTDRLLDVVAASRPSNLLSAAAVLSRRVQRHTATLCQAGNS
jgi:hypothetical protein